MLHLSNIVFSYFEMNTRKLIERKMNGEFRRLYSDPTVVVQVLLTQTVVVTGTQNVGAKAMEDSVLPCCIQRNGLKAEFSNTFDHNLSLL